MCENLEFSSPILYQIYENIFRFSESSLAMLFRLVRAVTSSPNCKMFVVDVLRIVFLDFLEAIL